MELSEYLPFWNKLTDSQKDIVMNTASEKSFDKGHVLHNGSQDCMGLIAVKSGRLRVFTLPDDGREITLYRLMQWDICILSASCIMKNVQFEISIQAEQDTTILHIPTDVYQTLMNESIAVANYTNELMASRFSDVMWTLDQILNKKLDSRLAAFLVEESSLTGSDLLHITHEQIAHHLGSAREVVTRMLKYFQNENVLLLNRGGIQIVDKNKLYEMASESIK